MHTPWALQLFVYHLRNLLHRVLVPVMLHN